MTEEADRLTQALGGRYTVQREVGRGGMAVVYRAHDARHNRDVALKVLNPELAAAVGTERFLREIEIVARLHHPHILPLYDSGSSDGTLYYVMPFVEGESLHDRLLRERQLGVEEAIHIAREVADALHHAHSQHIIHRDIKPANIMLVSNHAVVSDFGVALLAQALNGQRLTTAGVSPGTPLYMSPEQSAAQPDVDGRSDIYSLGCVLYEMLAGEPPFTGPSLHAIMAKKALGQPTPLHLVRDSVSELLESVTLKALARTPADRFRTAAEFAQALDSAALELHEPSAAWRAARSAGSGHDAGHGSTAADLREQQQRGRARPEPAPTLQRVLRITAAAVAAFLLPTAVGFLATTVYDLVVRVPYQFTPSRADFTQIGLRALIPVIYTAFVLLVAYFFARQLLRLAGVGLRRTHLHASTAHMKENAGRRWYALWERNDPAAIAELWFALAVGAAIIVVGAFVAAVRAASDGGSGIFACEHRQTHKNFTVAMTVLITALAISWTHVFRYLAARRASGTSFTLARWGGLVLIVGLTLILTAPWRLLWTTTPRATLHGERYYILCETDANVLLYNPRTRITQQYRLDELPQLRRLNTSGYLFEGETAFASPEPGC